MSRSCGRRSPATGSGRSRASASSGPKPCGSGGPSDMPEDTSPISGKSADLATPRFEVPEFMVPKSLAEVRELARLIALAEWAPDSYRDPDGNYVQQKIELAIMHGATVGLGPVGAVQSIAVIDGMPTIWGDGALAIVERSGLLDDMLEENETDPEGGLTAVCTI